MNDIESQDIDTESDFIITENIMKGYCFNKNKIVLITGACGGIGLSTAQIFKNNGWKVVGIDVKNNTNMLNIIDELFIIDDISNEEELIKFTQDYHSKYSRLDCIINNAASQICKPIHETDNNDWTTIMNTNVTPFFLLSKYFRDLLIKTKGSIVNISSVHAICTSENIALYAGSKGCLSALTRAMALEYSKVGIRINCILPGAVNTEMLRAGLMRETFGNIDISERLENLGSKHCIGRIGEPYEIGELILFLADNNRSSYIIGQSIVIDGGATIKLSTE